MRIALIGDSIRMGYEDLVTAMLGDHEIFSPDENGGDSSKLLSHLDEWFVESKCDIIHFNCGLHDIRLNPDDKTHQIEIGEYRSNLEEIARRLGELEGCTVIWVTTTPAVEAKTCEPGRTFHRYNRDIDAYNAVAGEIAAAAGFETNDLGAFVTERGPDELISDGVHFTPEGKQLLADRVVEFLGPFLV